MSYFRDRLHKLLNRAVSDDLASRMVTRNIWHSHSMKSGLEGRTK